MARITLGAERFDTEASGPEYRGLEAGDILYFPVSPPLLPDEDRAFLVTQKQVDASYHKNISYRPLEDRLKGVDQARLRSACTRSRDHAWLLATCHCVHGDVFEAVRGELEDRLRELSTHRGIGSQGCLAFSQ